MQYFYTRNSALLSNLRTALSLCGRMGHSLSVHSLRAVILLCTLAFSCGVWGETCVIDYSTASTTHSLFPTTKEQIQYQYKGNTNIDNWKLISFEKDVAIEFTNLTGASITSIKFEGVADNNSNKPAVVSVSVGQNTAKTGSGSWNNRKSATALSSQTINANSLKAIPDINKQGQKFSISASYALGLRITITYTPSSCTSPKITTEPQSANYSVGATATPLQVAATGDGTLTYQWQSSTDNTTFTNITNATNDTYTPPTDKAGVSYYRCIVSSGTCTATSASATITVAAGGTDPILHTITYHANMPMAWGKTVPFYAANIPADPATVNAGDTYTLSGNEPVINVNETTDYAIYTFAGWNTQADGKGTAYKAGGTIKNVSGNITLYAQWTPRAFNITYYDDNKTTKLSLTPNTYTYPVSTVFPTPTKTGYTFVGWKTADGATVTETKEYYGDFTLYAEWKEAVADYTDTYIWKSDSKYEGCVDDPAAKANANQSKAVTKKTYSSSTITGGEKMGRPKTPGDYSITIAAHTGFLIESICTYGKVETASQYSWDGGLTWTDLAAYEKDKKQVFTAPAAGAASFIIKCTTTSDNGGIWWRNALVTVKHAGNVTVTLNPNGGTLTDATGWTAQMDGTYTRTVVKGSNFSLPEITQTGHTFLYYTDETNDEYMPNKPFIINADYTFTAQWCSSATKLQWSATDWLYGDGNAPVLTSTGLPADAQIKYVSSNERVANISDDGQEITARMEGTTTITALYDGEDEYCPAEASYTLRVECNIPAPQIAGSGALAGCNTSITLRVVQETDGTDYPTTGYSFQWYRNGQTITGATSSTYTAETVGEYYVVVRGNSCSVLSVNTAKITSSAPTPETEALTRFQYYRPGHTYTANADIRHLFAYRSAGSDKTKCNITAVRKRAGAADETIADLSFLQTVTAADANGCDTVTASLNGISTDIDNILQTGDTLVVTLTPYDNCNELATAYARSINIYIIDKPALAFIISGADSYTRNKEKHVLHGDFLTGINKADLCKQSGSGWAESDKQNELPLYTALKGEFEVVSVNGYAAFNRLNYEPFDIVMLTDFPKTDAINEKTHPAYGVLDSLAYLVDYRPMFSLKGHMAKKELTTWANKGFIANPATPSVNPQTDMTVLCYAHGIFDGLQDMKYTGTTTPTKTDSLTKILLDEDGNIVVRITDGGGYNKKKALQGFVAVDANNFVNIAIIPEGKSGGSLVTCCERQTNINARLLLLSINADATSKITSIGEKAIIQGLHYLLQTDAAAVSDCSVTFHNNNDTGDHLWTTGSNWSTGRMPLKEQNVQIIANCTVNTIDATGANIRIERGKTVTVNSNAALKVTGKIMQMEASNHNATSPLTDPNVITIKADANGTGALIHTTDDDETLAATVELYSKAHIETQADGTKLKYWQYIGIPVKEAPVPLNFYGAHTYLYSESMADNAGWIRKFDGSSLYGDFSGYATSQPAPETFVLKGDLVSATDRRIPLTVTAGAGEGSNLIGNSWTAPIRIDSLKTSDFNNAEATVYIYNTGRDDFKDNPSYIKGSTTAGQWMAIPVETAKTKDWTGIKVIPAMQAFQVNTSTATELYLNYNRLVRSSTTTDINAPLRAPKRGTDELSMMRVRVSDSRTHTDLYIAQHPFFSDRFDNGWDATFIGGDGRSASLYAITPAGEMAVAAQAQTEGTVLGFVPGRETEYTFSFDYTGEMLYLNDTKQKRSTLITDWNTYTFTAGENDDVNRFYISSTPIDAQISTGLADLTSADGVLRISNPAHESLRIGVYDAAGRLCALSHTAEAMTDLPLPPAQGVYLIYIYGENTRIVRKVTR